MSAKTEVAVAKTQETAALWVVTTFVCRGRSAVMAKAEATAAKKKSSNDGLWHKFKKNFKRPPTDDFRAIYSLGKRPAPPPKIARTSYPRHRARISTDFVLLALWALTPTV